MLLVSLQALNASITGTHVDTMPGHTFDYDAWENAAWEALLLLDKYLKTDQNDMTRLHGNISLLFTPSVGIHFVQWNDKQTRRGILFLFCLHVYNRSSNTQGQMVLLDSENRVISIVNHMPIHKPQLFTAAGSGSIIIVNDVQVPMVRMKGLRHTVPQEAEDTPFYNLRMRNFII